MPDQLKLTHFVLFWLKRPDSAEDRAALIAGLETLSAIDQVRTLQIGVPAATDGRGPVDHSWAVSETMTFDSLADELAYQTHPVHLAFIARCESLWDRVVVYDIAEAG